MRRGEGGGDVALGERSRAGGGIPCMRAPYHTPAYVLHAAGGTDIRRVSVCMGIGVVVERVRSRMHPVGRQSHALDGPPISSVLA